jgi:hypothetical protein
MNIEQIERLREAAKEHGEVSDLLDALAASFPFFAEGDREFKGSELDAEHLKSALIAAQFAAYDRGEDGSTS